MKTVSKYISPMSAVLLLLGSIAFAKEAKKPSSGTIEGTVVENTASIPGRRITLVSMEMIPETNTPLRYVFTIQATPSKTIIFGQDVEKVGTRLKVEYDKLHRSEMDYFYEGNATRVIKILGPDAFSNPLLVRMKRAADQEAVKLGYDIKNMGVELDVANSQWKKYSGMQQGLPNNISKITGKDFIAVYYFPIPPPNKVVTGGDLWVFVDRVSAEVITSILGQ